MNNKKMECNCDGDNKEESTFFYKNQNVDFNYCEFHKNNLEKSIFTGDVKN